MKTKSSYSSESRSNSPSTNFQSIMLQISKRKATHLSLNMDLSEKPRQIQSVIYDQHVKLMKLRKMEECIKTMNLKIISLANFLFRSRGTDIEGIIVLGFFDHYCLSLRTTSNHRAGNVKSFIKRMSKSKKERKVWGSEMVLVTRTCLSSSSEINKSFEITFSRERNSCFFNSPHVGAYDRGMTFFNIFICFLKLSLKQWVGFLAGVCNFTWCRSMSQGSFIFLTILKWKYTPHSELIDSLKSP